MDLVDPTEEILHRVMKPFDFSNPIMDPEKLHYDFGQVMKTNHGIGLSAPQVGIDARAFTMGDDWTHESYFNPMIIQRSDEFEMSQEGCLSYPGIFLNIRRPKWILVEYQDQHGIAKTNKFEGIWARCFVHESDHLEGVCFVDLVGPLALKLAIKRREKWIRKAK